MVDAQTVRELRDQNKPMEEIREFTDKQDYRELRKIIVSGVLEIQTGHSGFVGYLISRVHAGEEVGLAISDHTANIGSLGTVILWMIEMIIIAVVIGVCIS